MVNCLKKDKEKNNVLRLGILMAIMIVFIVLTFKLIFKNQDINQIRDILKNADGFYIALAVGAITLYVFFGGYAIKVPIDSMGYKMPYRACFKYSLTEIYFSGVTPSNTGGQPMIAVSMKGDNYRFADIAMVLMAVTAIYKVGIMFIALVLLFCNFTYVFHIMGYVRFLFYLGVFINIVFVGLIVLLMFSNHIFWIVEKVVLNFLVKIHIVKNKEKFKEKIVEQKQKYAHCAEFFKGSPIVVIKMFIVLIAQRLALLIITYFVYKSFGLTGTSLFQILAIQTVLSLSVEMMPLPGAVGVTESVFILLYDAVFGKFLVYPALLLTRGLNFYLPFIVSTVYIFARFLRSLLFSRRNKNVGLL